MVLKKVTYVDRVTVIGADNLNNIQDAIIALEGEEKLPSATAADNGKILRIVDGKWAIANAPSGGGGSGGGSSGGGYVCADVVDGVLVVYSSDVSPASLDEPSSASVITGPVGYVLVNGADASVVSEDSLSIG